MRKTKPKKETEMYYSVAELAKLKYVKVLYHSSDNKLHEIRTEVKFIGDVLISLYFKYEQEFDINYPQNIILKFVTDSALYLAEAELQEVKQADDFIYFTIKPPAVMSRQQNRKYVRINLKRSCVLVRTDANGNSTTYLSKSINLSACGILLHNIETMQNDNFVTLEHSQGDTYNILIFLEADVILKLSAKYIRHEKVDESNRYAFQFTRMKSKNVDFICKYITNEQVKQLKQRRACL